MQSLMAQASQGTGGILKFAGDLLQRTAETISNPQDALFDAANVIHGVARHFLSLDRRSSVPENDPHQGNLRRPRIRRAATEPAGQPGSSMGIDAIVADVLNFSGTGVPTPTIPDSSVRLLAGELLDHADLHEGELARAKDVFRLAGSSLEDLGDQYFYDSRLQLVPADALDNPEKLADWAMEQADISEDRRRGLIRAAIDSLAVNRDASPRQKLARESSDKSTEIASQPDTQASTSKRSQKKNSKIDPEIGEMMAAARQEAKRNRESRLATVQQATEKLTEMSKDMDAPLFESAKRALQLRSEERFMATNHGMTPPDEPQKLAQWAVDVVSFMKAEENLHKFLKNNRISEDEYKVAAKEIASPDGAQYAQDLNAKINKGLEAAGVDAARRQQLLAAL